MNNDLTTITAIPSTWGFAKRELPSTPKPSLRDEAAAYVHEKIGQSGSASTESRLAAIRKAATTVTKASRAQHHEAVALAYAIYLAHNDEPDFRELIAGLAADARLRVTKATDPLAIIVGSLITYGGGSDAAATRKLRSRDVQAIRYLVRKRVAPDGVSAEAARKGEGLDAWARRIGDGLAARKKLATTRSSVGPHQHAWTLSGFGRFRFDTPVPLDRTKRKLLKLAITIVFQGIERHKKRRITSDAPVCII